MHMRHGALAATLAAFIARPLYAAAPMATDVSSRTIDIDAKFAGARLWLFGARQASGELAYVVRGPKQSYRVSEKKRVMGIWVNTRPVRFHDVPGYYMMGSTGNGPSPDERALYADMFRAELPGAFTGKYSSLFPSHTAKYHAPLMKAMIKNRLYSPELHRVRFIGDTLFKAELPFAANIPRGVYTVETYLTDKGQLAAAETIPVTVRKKGFDAFLYELAYNHAWIYACACVAVALGLGWIGGQIFRRV
ncbi:MAG: TIGR02186 family protein [Rickettsiales bacterium]